MYQFFISISLSSVRLVFLLLEKIHTCMIMKPLTNLLLTSYQEESNQGFETSANFLTRPTNPLKQSSAIFYLKFISVNFTLDGPGGVEEGHGYPGEEGALAQQPLVVRDVGAVAGPQQQRAAQPQHHVLADVVLRYLT